MKRQTGRITNQDGPETRHFKAVLRAYDETRDRGDMFEAFKEALARSVRPFNASSLDEETFLTVLATGYMLAIYSRNFLNKFVHGGLAMAGLPRIHIRRDLVSPFGQVAASYIPGAGIINMNEHEPPKITNVSHEMWHYWQDTTGFMKAYLKAMKGDPERRGLHTAAMESGAYFFMAKFEDEILNRSDAGIGSSISALDHTLAPARFSGRSLVADYIIECLAVTSDFFRKSFGEGNFGGAGLDSEIQAITRTSAGVPLAAEDLHRISAVIAPTMAALLAHAGAGFDTGATVNALGESLDSAIRAICRADTAMMEELARRIRETGLRWPPENTPGFII